ncbi:MAG: hypothetical protein Q4D13_04550 [Erysipelotrichaceae bacterium]|nr:hypothetical protein [Erysipelotrichaceae bacterium]
MKWTYVLIVLAILSLIIQIYVQYKKRSAQEYLTGLLSSGKYDEFDEAVDSDRIKRWIPEFNRLYVKLNKEIMCGNADKVEDIINGVRLMNLGDTYKGKIYTLIYNYYLSRKDYERCKEYYKLISGIKNYDTHELDITHNTFVRNGYKYLDEVMDKMNSLPENQRGVYELLIGKMYRNKGETDKAIEYESLAGKHMRQGG